MTGKEEFLQPASKIICTDSKYSTPTHLPPRVAAAETLCWSKFWSVFLFKMHNISPPLSLLSNSVLLGSVKFSESLNPDLSVPRIKFVTSRPAPAGQNKSFFSPPFKNARGEF